MSLDIKYAPQVQEALERIRTHPVASVDDFAVVAGVARSTAYAYAKRGELPTVMVGRRLRIPSRWILQALRLDEPAASA